MWWPGLARAFRESTIANEALYHCGHDELPVAEVLADFLLNGPGQPFITRIDFDITNHRSGLVKDTAVFQQLQVRDVSFLRVVHKDKICWLPLKPLRDVHKLGMDGANPNLHLGVQASKLNDLGRNCCEKLVLFHAQELAALRQVSCYSQSAVSAIGAHLKAAHGFPRASLQLNLLLNFLLNLLPSDIPFLCSLSTEGLVPEGIHGRNYAFRIARLSVRDDVLEKGSLQAVHGLGAHLLHGSLGLCSHHPRRQGH
mmetsp:Transcript_31086/g.58305  ORF Transcript_31086/g.58305 Transcript_31086/m.58305 type:complete len:255 (-) Transcript_31086:1260-2024(-)